MGDYVTLTDLIIAGKLDPNDTLYMNWLEPRKVFVVSIVKVGSEYELRYTNSKGQSVTTPKAGTLVRGILTLEGIPTEFARGKSWQVLYRKIPGSPINDTLMSMRAKFAHEILGPVGVVSILGASNPNADSVPKRVIVRPGSDIDNVIAAFSKLHIDIKPSEIGENDDLPAQRR